MIPLDVSQPFALFTYLLFLVTGFYWLKRNRAVIFILPVFIGILGVAYYIAIMFFGLPGHGWSAILRNNQNMINLVFANYMGMIYARYLRDK